MAKNKYPKDGGDEKFENSEGSNYKQSDVSRYNVINRENSVMEVTVGRELLRFEAHGINPVSPEEYKDGLPRELVEHPDFQSAKKYFTIVER